MPNCGQLIDETITLLLGSSGDSDQVTTLAGNIGPTDLTFQVTQVRNGAMGLSAGTVEIGTELLFVSAIGTDGTATVEPWGRGYKHTTAQSHTAGDKVTSTPTYPRSAVLSALNSAIGRVYPDLFVPKLYRTTTTFPQLTYDVPDDCEWILDARWQLPVGFEYWTAVQRYRLSQGVGDSPDTKTTVDVADSMVPGQPLEFTYAAQPGLLVNENDDFVATTGLPLSCWDLIKYGAAGGDLVASQELSRLQTSSIEQQNRAGLVGPDSGLTSSRYLEAMYQMRLKEEQAALRRRYPIRIGRAWV